MNEWKYRKVERKRQSFWLTFMVSMIIKPYFKGRIIWCFWIFLGEKRLLRSNQKCQNVIKNIGRSVKGGRNFFKWWRKAKRTFSLWIWSTRDRRGCSSGKWGWRIRGNIPKDDGEQKNHGCSCADLSLYMRGQFGKCRWLSYSGDTCVSGGGGIWLKRETVCALCLWMWTAFWMI